MILEAISGAVYGMLIAAGIVATVHFNCGVIGNRPGAP